MAASRTSPRMWAMWALAVSVYFTAVFHRSGLAVASLDAEHRFGVGPSVLAAFVAVQLGVYALMQIPTGAMADRFGPKRMLSAAVVLMAGGELAFAFTHSAVLALIGRGLVGLGDAVTFLSVLRLAQNWFPVTRYGLLASLTGLVGAVGQLVSTVPLHASLTHLGWTTTFAGSGLITLAVGVPLWSTLRDRPSGAATGASGAEPDIEVEAVAPSVGRRARGGDHRMVDAVREVMARRGTWRGMWAHFTLTGPFAVFTALWGYPFLVRAEHYRAARASEALALVVLSAVVTAPGVGVLMVRAPAWRPAIVYGAAGLLFACWVLTLGLGPGHDPGWVIAALLVLTGVAGPTSAVAFDLAREANPHERGGAATGVVNIGGFTAAVLADLAIGALLDTVGHGGHTPSGFTGAMAVIPTLMVVGAVAFWWSGRRPIGDRGLTRSAPAARGAISA